MKKILKKILSETNWEPLLCVVGATVTSLSIILPIIPAIDRKTVGGCHYGRLPGQYADSTGLW